jgi:hypothetical protein
MRKVQNAHSPTRAARSVVTWCQPMDTNLADVVMVNHHDVSAEEAVSQEVVVQINTASAGAARNQLSRGGWVAEAGHGLVAELATVSDSAGLGATVAVYVPDRQPKTLDRAQAQVEQTAQLAGYPGLHQTIHEADQVVRYQPGKPWSMLRAILRLLGFGQNVKHRSIETKSPPSGHIRDTKSMTHLTASRDSETSPHRGKK